MYDAKNFLKKIRVNIKPILQIVLLIFFLILPIAMNLKQRVFGVLEVPVSTNPWEYLIYFAWDFGNALIGLVIAGAFYFIISKENRNCRFNDNGDVYNDYPYLWYKICRFLGYQECSLVLVPICMQFKLVVKGVFKKYYCGDIDDRENDIISVRRENFSNIDGEVNFFIADTYAIKEEQIPLSKRTKPTIWISRSDNIHDHTRYGNPELVKAVVNAVGDLPVSCKQVNIFATTNPKNTLHIAQQAFGSGIRGSLDKVTVFQQEFSGIRKFENLGMVVFKR